MRMFVAVVPPPEVVERIERRSSSRADDADPRCAGPQPYQWHLTLAFLPEVGARSLDDLVERLTRAAARRSPFTVTLAGSGAFPSPERARVLWLGATADPPDSLSHLATGVRAAANKAGAVVEGGRFRAHLTLARLRKPQDATRWLRILELVRRPRLAGTARSSSSSRTSARAPAATPATRRSPVDASRRCRRRSSSQGGRPPQPAEHRLHRLTRCTTGLVRTNAAHVGSSSHPDRLDRRRLPGRLPRLLELGPGRPGQPIASPGPGAEPQYRHPRAQVGGCDVFPANNYWNTPVTDLDVDSHSAAWLSHMSPRQQLHPDFGKSYGEQPVPYGIPITVVDGSHPKVDVTFHYAMRATRGRTRSATTP